MYLLLLPGAGAGMMTVAEIHEIEAENQRLKAEVKSLERFRDLRTRHNQELEDRTKELLSVKAERDDYGRQAWDARVLASTLHVEAIESAKRGYGLANHIDGPRIGTGPLATYEAKLKAIWESSGIDRPDPSLVPCMEYGCEWPALAQTIVAPKCMRHKAHDPLPGLLNNLSTYKEGIEILRGAMHRLLQSSAQVQTWVERNNTEHIIRVKMAPVLKELLDSIVACMTPMARTHPETMECHRRRPLSAESRPRGTR
jgi:hypothetical protein